MINRLFNRPINNSFFLFWPRGSGKSSLLRKLFFEKVLWIDLLDPETEDRYALHPSSLKDEILKVKKEINWVVLDEIQKVPRLLDVVHQMIESDAIKFALTGSSARKLKKGSANLLAGRAFVKYLFPLTHLEMGSQLDLLSALQWVGDFRFSENQVVRSCR